MHNFARLRDFLEGFGALLDEAPPEPAIHARGGRLLGELIAVDDWLPAAYAQPDPDRYQQYLLHADSRQRFSLVSFVWGPGQQTPIHDHTVWGLIGVLRGAELSQPYIRDAEGCLHEDGPVHRLEAGTVEAVSPSIGDIHRVRNAFDDQVSISVHLYGANIGGVKRSTYDPDGRPKTFISGYSNDTLPNIWNISRE